MTGCDISVHQGIIDFSQLKKETDFVMIRAGYGTKFDANLELNTAGCEMNGIPYGYYWASYALTPTDGLKEAHKCLEAIKHRNPAFPIVYDLEYFTHNNMKANHIQPTKELTNSIISVFCEELEYHNYYTMVYSNLDYLHNWIEPSLLNRFDLWYANWTEKTPSARCGIFQYTNKGSLAGIDVNVDMDEAYNNYPQIIANKKLNQYR